MQQHAGRCKNSTCKAEPSPLPRLQTPSLPPTECHCALHTPEIVAAILEQLSSDAPAVLRAAQVNRLWARKALSMLWYRPPPEALGQIRSNARRRYYAEWVGAIVADDGISACILGPWAPYLRPEQLMVPADVTRLDGTIWARLFQPRLWWLRCSTAAFVGEATRQLVTRSPQLVEILLDEDVEVGMDPALFLSILRKVKGLRTLDFIGSNRSATPDFLSKATFLHLSKLESLRRVTTPGAVSDSCLSHVLRYNRRPFPNARSLGIDVESAAVPLLARMFPHLTLSLQLCVLDNKHSVFPHLVSWLSHLQRLHVILPVGSKLTPDDIDALARLTQLRSLRCSAYSHPLSATWFTDSHLERLLRGIPHLDSLELILWHALSTSAYLLAGKYCPCLESLHLYGRFDLVALETAPAPLFSRLESLQLGSIVEHASVR
jgi:hypothetical protein